MSTAATEHRSLAASADRRELATVLEAVRSRLGVVSMLLIAAGVAWWSTDARMAGMDAGPGSGLGTLGWFSGVWTVMMAAMMLPSVAPTAAVYATLTRRREPSRWLLFAGGYLLVWSAAGVIAYALFELGKNLFATDLAWHAGGRSLAAGVLALAAVYQLTPPKACVPGEVSKPAPSPLRSLARRLVRSIHAGRAHRRLVRSLLVVADGRTVRARSDEPDVDGGRRSARGAREARSRAPRGDGRDGDRPGCARGRDPRRA